MSANPPAIPSLGLDLDASVPEKRDHFGIAGWTAPGATVDIVVDGHTVTSVIAGSDGGFAYQAATWPTSGRHEFIAVVHGDGTLTAASAPLEFDSTGAVPQAPTIGSSFYTSSNNNYYIHAQGQFLYGNAAPASTVRVWSGSTLFMLAKSDASGFWHAQAPTLDDGAYHFTATATNEAGTSAAGPAWDVRVDEHAPAAPLVALGNSVDGLVSDDKVVFSGTAEPGALIILSINDVLYNAQAYAQPDGHWSAQLALPAGKYMVTASAVDEAQHQSAPSQSIAFSKAGDIAGDSSTTAQLAVGSSAVGDIEQLGDHDWFKVSLNALTEYQFTLKAAESNAGTLAMGKSGFYETFLRLWDPQGGNGTLTQVGNMQNAAYGAPETILFSPTHAGTYFLDMGASHATGTYTLSAAVLAVDDYANDIAHASIVPLDSHIDGKIDYAGDVDQFQLALHAGITYSIALDSGGAAYGTVQRSLEQSGGPAAASSSTVNNWSGAGTLSLRPSADGIYDIAVAGGTGDNIPYHLVATATSDDYPANTTTSGHAALGTTVRGTLEVAADADWFMSTFTAGQPYLLRALGPHGEALDLAVFDALGKQVVFGSDTVRGADSTAWRPPTSGNYFIEVSSTLDSGAYTLLVDQAPADDHGASAAGSGILTPGQTVAGALEIPGDADWFKVALAAGSDYVFNVDTAHDGHTLEASAQLHLFDSTGKELTSASGDTTQLAFHAGADGDYYLSVEDNMRHIGSYGVSMFATAQDTLSANASTSGSLSPGGVLTSSIDFATDTDWVRVDLKAHQAYDFQLTGARERGGTLPSTLLSLRLLDAHGLDVAYSQFSYFNDPTLHVVAPATDATYYVAVSTQSNATGSYTLKEKNDQIGYTDTLPPLLGTVMTPKTLLDHARGDNIVLHFDEVVQLGSAAITLKLATGEVVESFSAANANTSLPPGYNSLSLMPVTPLAYGTDYVLTLSPASVTDTTGHPFAGTTLTFHTLDAPPRQDGSAGNDVFHARNGDENIDGKGGLDSVIFVDSVSNYRLIATNDGIAVSAPSGVHDLVGVERVVFSDLSVAFDISGNAGQVYRLYQAAFDRRPDSGGLGYWIAQMDRGVSLHDVANGFLSSAEVSARFGASQTDADFVKSLYADVLHRAPDQSGADYWAGVLQGGTSRADVLCVFSESAENQAAVIGQIGHGIWYQPYL
jgi:hypothetical protein